MRSWTNSSRESHFDRGDDGCRRRNGVGILEVELKRLGEVGERLLDSAALARHVHLQALRDVEFPLALECRGQLRRPLLRGHEEWPTTGWAHSPRPGSRADDALELIHRGGLRGEFLFRASPSSRKTDRMSDPSCC